MFQCYTELSAGRDVAVVFNVKRGENLPKLWQGTRVIDGDEHDLRFLHEHYTKQGSIVGLRAKGKAKGANTGFVVNPE